MARATYNVKHTYIGNGSKAEYDFDFKIEESTQLLAIETDENGDLVARVRGDDTATLLSSIEFDSVNGGGSVTLQSNLDSNHELLLLLANDSPTQPTQFRRKGSFTLKQFEMALDWLGGAIQRLAYLTDRSLRLDEIDDESSFEAKLPAGIESASDKLLGINSDGDAFEFKDPAVVAASTAGLLVAANNLSDVDDVATARSNLGIGSPIVNGNDDILDSQTNTNIGDWTLDVSNYTSGIFWVEITRGSTILANGVYYLQNVNGTWRLNPGMYNGEDHGVTLDVTESGGVATVNYDSDTKGAGKIKWNGILFGA